MKKLFLLSIVIFVMNSLNAQNCEAIFFNQDGNKFQIILNGVLQNSDYETNVKVTDLSFQASYKVTIKFENNQFNDVLKTVYMVDQNTQYTYNIKKNGKGIYVLRMASAVPIAQAPKSNPTQSVIVYSTPPLTTSSITSTTTTTSTTSNISNENNLDGNDNVSMGVNVGGVGMNVNVNVNDGVANTGTATTSTTYSETTTTTSTISSTPNEPNESVVPEEQHYVMTGYNGPIGCPYPMSDENFNSAKKSIASKSFSDSKLTLAKQITNSNCLTSDQAKQIIMLFDYEATKLEYAKFAYGHYDIGNYYKVNDAFDFESSIKELDDFINNK